MNLKPENLFVRMLEKDFSNSGKTQFENEAANNTSFSERFAVLGRTQAALKTYSPDFSEGFVQRTIQKISLQMEASKRQKHVFKLMLRISMASAAAAALFLAYVIWQENAASIDGLLGLSGLKTEDFTNLLANY